MKRQTKATVAILIFTISASAHAGIFTKLAVGAALAGSTAFVATSAGAKPRVDCTDPDVRAKHPFICAGKDKIAAEKEKLKEMKEAKQSK